MLVGKRDKFDLAPIIAHVVYYNTMRTSPTHKKHANIGTFAAQVLHRPLYPFQVEIGNAILDSVLNGLGLTFTVMVSRQSGKNQISALLEAYLLCAYRDGTIIKCAPTWKPQILNSRLRLLQMLDTDFLRSRIFKSYGYMIGLAPSPALAGNQIGPRVMFFSAAEEAQVVGATASLLLEIDEAQDVSAAKFDRDFRPMASTTNATTVLYGTAWSDDTLLAITRAHNVELEARDGIRRHFEYTWHELAAHNAHYKQFVEAEIARLGPDHLTIRTQYELQPISGAGFLLSDLQRHMICGRHRWLSGPEEGDYYIGSLDIGGEERAKHGEETRSNKRDSTVFTIARVKYNELMLPSIEVVHQMMWNGMPYLEQYGLIVELCEVWGIRKLVVDKTGLGEMMASTLQAKLGEERVQQFHFTRPSKSALAYEFLALINSGRLKIYAQEGAPDAIYQECMKQLKLARYTVPGEGLLNMLVLPAEGHDDFLISVALLASAIRESRTAVTESQVVRPRPLYRDGWY